MTKNSNKGKCERLPVHLEKNGVRWVTPLGNMKLRHILLLLLLLLLCDADNDDMSDDIFLVDRLFFVWNST
jgi:hypothetical protein